MLVIVLGEAVRFEEAFQVIQCLSSLSMKLPDTGLQ